MSPRDIDVAREGLVVVARLRGDIDMASIPAVSAHVLDALTMDVAGLVVDLTEVKYVDSAGVQMLFDLARRLEAGRQGMALALAADSPVRGLLRITSLDQAVAICTTYDDAMQSVFDGARRSY
ncbi:MAG TPA: STAS domain-containing protein [Mycobacteriales bacterium]|nr:STAS domain-containing protein [Mycobacteriales bacterium]